MRAAPATVIVTILAVARISRLVTTDTLGKWTIRDPAERWANEHEIQAIMAESFEDPEHSDYDEADPISWQKRLVTGLSCPHCFGAWAGGAVLLGNTIAPHIPVVRHVWPFMLKALALSYLVGHISERID
jgi:hypothetical protein